MSATPQGPTPTSSQTKRGPARYVAASLAVLVPCFWQSRLQAGDLSSHLYNAWLAELIEQGHAPGLAIARQTTNILFDWMLSALLGAVGAGAAQRISVAIAVLVFVWGAFAFVSALSESRGWGSLPLLSILAYGWVFHMGFFNFYLSLGLCLGALALCWTGEPPRCAIALPVLALAWLAHALPVVWALGLLAHLWTARRLSLRARAWLLAAAFVAMILLSAAVRSRITTLWFPTQILSATGLDQVWVFDVKYLTLAAGMVLLWGLPFIGMARRSGLATVIFSVPFQFCALTAFATLVFPASVLIPGYKHSLAYISDRMSLPLSVCFCALAAAGPRRAAQQYLAGVITLAFFAFLFHDERALNAFEDRMELSVASLPPGQRVISAIDASGLRVNGLGHMIDRVCIGRCYSYANYEPSTAQFRVRVIGESPLVISTYAESWALQTGKYKVKERDLPLYEINLDSSGRMVTLPLKVGSTSGITEWNPL